MRRNCGQLLCELEEELLKQSHKLVEENPKVLWNTRIRIDNSFWKYAKCLFEIYEMIVLPGPPKKF